ncbi:hypothetical protein GIB67_016546 [Kingdonia uniflora]|uniref:acyl-CoA oxidase n=1 Tax=Kingdonia uniflora TaxID=39325 RepID=A0A7J7NQC0_9MAGN|nr:hypothetical protein GIB67_016546 [Kingdonia uniflora]
MYKNTLRKAAHVWKRIIELRLSEQEAFMLRFYVTFTDLHWGMFIPAIKGQGTEQQQQKWLPLAYKMQIIGCYAQTELGHGSNVQGLETTATFDRKSDEFIINSPTLTSRKWWPGGLGKASTHGVVYARLLVDEKDHGVNGFIVQLQSFDDHSPLPGITVADIGMKFGNGAYKTMDNGVIRFNHVTREGKYVQSDVPRQLFYGTMVYVRQTIVANASCALSRAVCITTRYSAVRRQFGSQDGGPETQVIDYKTQQNKLFPLVATAYAYRFIGEWLKWLYTDATQRLQASDFSTLPKAHACTADLKSLTTSSTADAIEECRKLCSSHGYLCSSGIPELFAVYVPACTYEGDNVVLLLQCCSDVQQAEDWLNPSAILEAFESRAARISVACARNINKMPSQEEGFDELSSDLVETAVAHCQLIIVSKFIQKLKQDIPGKGVKEQLQILCNIYALFLLHKHQGEFLATGAIILKQASLASSVLGRYDGNVYPNLYAKAWEELLNDTVVPDDYREYIRPMLKQQLRTARL